MKFLTMDENNISINVTDSISTGSIDLINPRTPWKYNEEEILQELLNMFGELTISTILLVTIKFRHLIRLKHVETAKHSAVATFSSMPLDMIRKAPHDRIL